MANPMLIQKQIKDNSEELHNFVRDLKLWEEEMKRKDRQLSNEPVEEILPPVRRAKISDKQQAKKQDTNEIDPNKRIPSYDYKSWDKFDVDKACEEVDNDSNKSEESTNGEDAQQEEKYLKEKALYEKELGNRHVKASKWDEAIEAYTKAILAYPKDPVFFANRALCYLKKNRYDAAELDCTDSLKLDPTYVKAYLRRAAAHEALSQDEAAAYDLRRALQLEPHNTQAQQLLTSLTDKEKKKKDVDKRSKIKEQISQKNLNTTKPVPVPTKCQNSSPQSLESRKSHSASETNAKEVEISKNNEVPPWEPCDNVVEPISKPPHLRSKKSLKSVEIHDIGIDCPKHVCSRMTLKPQDPPSPVLPSTSTPTPAEPSSGMKPRSILTLNSPVSLSCLGVDVPPPPKTSVQFYKSWSSIKSDKLLCFQFLKQIPGESLPEIFKESLESRMFSSIVETLASQFTAADELVLPYLHGLSAVRRFSTITLFMTDDDKSNLMKLFQYCENKGECSEQDVIQLRRVYEMI